MAILLIMLIILASIIILILLLVFRYRSFFGKIKVIKRKKEKEKSLDVALEKYVREESKEPMKQKLEKITEMIAQTEAYIEDTVKKKVRVAKSQLKVKESEEALISKAKMEYNTFISDFKSAMPKTEKERVQDMKELKSAILMLETFDEESYEAKPKEYDAGLGMFYDKMSRRFLSIINENNLNKYDFIPIHEIKYYAFSNIKNIKNDDILPILNVMKDTELLRNLIEINPTFQIIVFNNGEKLDLTFPEKVLLTFAYEEDILTNQKLIELTDWKEDYANKIIEGLKDKGLIKFENEKITVENFGSVEERRNWNKIIQNKIEEEKKKEEEKRKQQLERAAKLKERLGEVEEAVISKESDSEKVLKQEPSKIKFKQKPAIKKLPKLEGEIKPEEVTSKDKLKEEQDIKDKDDLIGAMEALDIIAPAKSVEKLELKGDLLEEEISNLEELIPEKILSYHEKFTLINGGLSQYEKIKRFIERELGKISDDLIKSVLEQLIELQMIHGIYKIGDYDFYLFNELSLTEDEKTFIQFAINKKPMFKEDFIQGLNWDEEKILKTMKTLQEKSILRIENNEIIIPGIIQNR
ncbi:MAG: hypothetical protein ACFFHV_00125 [Promethearchaeota archaeon]